MHLHSLRQQITNAKLIRIPSFDLYNTITLKYYDFFKIFYTFLKYKHVFGWHSYGRLPSKRKQLGYLKHFHGERC